MNNRNLTAEQAIKRSVSHNEIVTIDVQGRSDPEFLALSEHSDDGVHNGEVTEFWGTTDDGDEWRVHARMPACR